MTHNIPKAPAGLSAEAKAIWAQVWREFDLEDSATIVLRLALEAFDRLRECQAVLRCDGLTTTDRFGQQRGHPLLATERDSRGAFLRAWKQLGLDLEPPMPNGRPAGARP